MIDVGYRPQRVLDAGAAFWQDQMQLERKKIYETETSSSDVRGMRVRGHDRTGNKHAGFEQHKSIQLF